jgi:hypothetical protein
MKKLITICVFLLSCNFVKAQELGIRFGDVLKNDVAVDALFSAGEFSRIHADVSFGSHGVGVEALWDFMYKPLGGEAFSWYLGVGPSIGFDDPFLLGASGEIGLSYTFNNAPISLSADWRPTFFILEDTDFSAGGFGVNARYVFGKR